MADSGLLWQQQFRPAVEHGVAADADALAAVFAVDGAAAMGELAGDELFLAEFFGPIRDQRAMRAAGDRVFVETRAGRKKSGDEIDFVALRGGDDPKAVEGREAWEIGR